MCVQCVMGAAAGFGIFQTYRFVIKDRARKLLGARVGSHAAETAPHTTPSSTPASAAETASQPVRNPA